MDSETRNLNDTGSLNWFLNTLQLIERDEFGVLKSLEGYEITNFGAIQALVTSAAQEKWRFFDSKNYQMNEIEQLVKLFVENHASVPYIGGTLLKTREPIGCLEGTTEDADTENVVQCKAAYWANGLVYYIEEKNTDKYFYLLTIDENTAKLYNYPESKKDQSE